MPLIFNVPVKLGLEFMATVGTNHLDTKGEGLDHVVDESNGILLGVTGIDFLRVASSMAVY